MLWLSFMKSIHIFYSFLNTWNYSKYEHKRKLMDYPFIFIYCSSFILIGTWNKCFLFCESFFLYFTSLVLFIMCHIILGLNTSDWSISYWTLYNNILLFYRCIIFSQSSQKSNYSFESLLLPLFSEFLFYVWFLWSPIFILKSFLNC